jgi:hypothetical protein
LHDDAERDQHEQIERRRLPRHAFARDAHQHDQRDVVRGRFGRLYP